MVAQNMSPEDYAQQQALNRQQQLAAMLMQQGQQMPQGQMVSGRYVPTSFFQNLVPLANIAASQYVGKKADTEQTKLAERIRTAKGEKEKAITNLIAGTPDQVTEMAGPYGQGVGKGGANVPMPVAVQPGTKPDLAAALREIGTNNPYGVGTEYKASILSNMMPKVPDAVAQYKFAQTPEGGSFKGSFNEFQNQMTPYQRQSLAIQAGNQAQSRVPMGYRMKQDGTLEAIPGGPADQKALTVNAGRETVDTLVTGLKSQYDILKEGGGITTKDNTFMNIPAYLSSTGVGQTTGKLFGTQNQSARNSIAQSRPLLLQAIKKATGASAKEMDSNVELQMYLKAATDPTLDYEANIYALEQLQTLYGIGGNAPIGGGAPAGGSLPSAADIDAEIARRQNKPR
jgi:hypothetical protein